MPGATFYQPIERILEGKLNYEYYHPTTGTYSQTTRTRICRVDLGGFDEDHDYAILMIFTIRNQPRPDSDEYVWKIHSEGAQRTDPGSTVPLRNAAVKLARDNGWKYFAIAVAAEGIPENENISKYVVSMESYDYGRETVYPLANDINKLVANNLPKFYRCEANIHEKYYSFSYIRKDVFIDYLTYFDNRPYKEVVVEIRDKEDEKKEILMSALNENRIKGGLNKIFYGAPGCGKSHHVKKILEDKGVSTSNIIRVTFHPEYANCDFVGQILPTVETKVASTGEKEDVVSYAFNPGPFTLALKKALETYEMVYLVIEEINRGNAAAIFGDLFQLLDREKDVDSKNFCASEYPICNVGIQDYLYSTLENDEIRELIKEGIIIPSNLTILATMNSSDQNVFTLDTAFKRRWYFEQISNDITKAVDHTYKNWYLPGTSVTWENFLIKLNEKILENKIQNQTNEDKRLGMYFVTKDCLTEKPESISAVRDVAQNFAYKVLEYIWNDVCRIGREDWFNTEKYKTLEALIDAFVFPKNEDSPVDVFETVLF